MSKPGASMKVLYGEQNEQVMATQAEALQKAGFTVQSAVGRKADLAQLWKVVQAPADSEVVGIVDGGFGAQRPISL